VWREPIWIKLRIGLLVRNLVVGIIFVGRSPITRVVIGYPEAVPEPDFYQDNAEAVYVMQKSAFLSWGTASARWIAIDLFEKVFLFCSPRAGRFNPRIAVAN
jgi:hypothetical protein